MSQYKEFIDPTQQADANIFVRAEHLARYLFAAEFVRRHKLYRALDCACGNGYGCRVLAGQAAQVHGVDANAALIEAAVQAEAEPGAGAITYRCADLNAGLPHVGSGTMDCAVCFETLEHIERDEALVGEFHRVLRRGGALLLSVPKAGYEPVGEAGKPRNPYHLRLYSPEGIAALVEGHGFAIEHVLGQPYANAARVRLENYRRDTGIGQEAIDGYFNETPESLAFFAKICGWPTKELAEQSNVIFLVCRKT